jgi:hypothetical protein
MPQFDYITFFNQTSWIFIVLLTFLVFLSKYVIPFFGTVLKTREKRFFFYKNFFFDILLLEKNQIFTNVELVYENFFVTLYRLINSFLELTHFLKNKFFIIIKNKFIFNYLKKIFILNILIFFLKYKYFKKKIKIIKYRIINRFKKKKINFFFKRILKINKTKNKIKNKNKNKKKALLK